MGLGLEMLNRERRLALRHGPEELAPAIPVDTWAMLAADLLFEQEDNNAHVRCQAPVEMLNRSKLWRDLTNHAVRWATSCPSTLEACIKGTC